MQTITDRFIELIDLAIANNTKFKTLENMSGIPAVSWRKAYLRGQRPTVEMIESMVTFWPEFAFWLATGITDSSHGHRRPGSEMIEIWVKDSDGVTRIEQKIIKRERTAAHAYFFKCIQMAKTSATKNNVETSAEQSEQITANIFLLKKEADRLRKIRSEQEISLARIELEEIEAIARNSSAIDYVSIEESESAIVKQTLPHSDSEVE